ncbi:ABC transporter substrate-binding protein [Nonomuraea thailandensis]
MKVSVIPILDVAPVYLGDQQGFFAAEGLKLELVTAQGGAAIVPAVVSGQVDFGFSNFTSLIVAASKGLPLKVVAPARDPRASRAPTSAAWSSRRTARSRPPRTSRASASRSTP